MDCELKSSLKRHFRNYSMLIVDLESLYAKYKTLAGSLYTSPTGVYLTLSGTVPYTFSGFIFKAPVLIKIPSDYPFSAPMCFVVPSKSIRIVKNHPNVAPGGSISLPYLDEWSHTSKLLNAVDAIHKAFSHMSPIYSASVEKGSLLTDQAKQPADITDQASPAGLFADYRLSDRDRNLVEHAHQNILSGLKRNREAVIRDYLYDMKKYELHRQMLENWAFALLDLNAAKLRLEEIEEAARAELGEGELREAEDMLDEVNDYVCSVTSANQLLSSLADEEFTVEDVVRFRDAQSDRLSSLIVAEASCGDMLEFLHETHKRGKISTRSYVKVGAVHLQEMRKLSHEAFVARLGREKLEISAPK